MFIYKQAGSLIAILIKKKKMPECRMVLASGQADTGMKKMPMPMPEPVQSS
jgi:hypothetical protein